MFFTPLYVDLESLCVEFHPLYVDLTPHITQPHYLKHRFLVTTITKTKRFFMGALVGALFTININKIDN